MRRRCLTRFRCRTSPRRSSRRSVCRTRRDVDAPSPTSAVQVIEWCIQHKEDQPAVGMDERHDEGVSEWDAEFFKVDMDTLFEIIKVGLGASASLTPVAPRTWTLGCQLPGGARAAGGGL